MNERQSDFELLQSYARHGDQPSFTTLVKRHLDLVYATALRKVQDQGAAEEVAQNVFTALMKKAWQFAPDDSLPAWLYKTSLLESKQWLRGELRRRTREQTAAELGSTMNTPDEQSALRALVPLLDEALLSLREKDRTALLLRFYEKRTLCDVGASLGVGEDAAQKRVSNALGKLAGWFQQRGFKTASVAVTATALEHTAISAPAAASNAVILAASHMAPPALVGLTAVAARLAALTKLQTAAVCVALVAGPMFWQWSSERSARDKVMHFQNLLGAVQKDLAAVRSELEQINAASEGLAALSAEAADAAARQSESQKKYVAWKNRLRAMLAAAEYRWPEDSPFVRIPKATLKQVGELHSINPPGVLRQEARELLGLTPQERKQVEASLQAHFSAMDDLLDTKIIETNQPVRVHIPDSAIASVAWSVSELGDEAARQAEELQTELKNILGDARWSLVKAQLQSSGIYTLRRVLNLDSGRENQEYAVWINERNGTPLVGVGISSGFSTSVTDGLSLDIVVSAMNKTSAGNVWGNEFGVPEAIGRRINEWIKLQGEMRLGKESSK